MVAVVCLAKPLELIRLIVGYETELLQCEIHSQCGVVSLKCA